MEPIVLLMVIGTTIWVGIDAGNLGMQRGRMGGGLLDMSVVGWVICCLLLWIVAFPCYLVARSRYQAMRVPYQQYGSPMLPVGQPAQPYSVPQPNPYAVPQQTVPVAYAPLAVPPQMSPDGRWWWNGQQWTPVGSPPAH